MWGGTDRKKNDPQIAQMTQIKTVIQQVVRGHFTALLRNMV